MLRKLMEIEEHYYTTDPEKPWGEYRITHTSFGPHDSYKAPYYPQKFAHENWQCFYPSNSDALGFSTLENAERYLDNIANGREEFDGIQRIDNATE